MNGGGAGRESEPARVGERKRPAARWVGVAGVLAGVVGVLVGGVNLLVGVVGEEARRTAQSCQVSLLVTLGSFRELLIAEC